MAVTFMGIDPGLVDTGIVVMTLDSKNREITWAHDVVKGLDALFIRAHVPFGLTQVYMEDYRVRKAGYAHNKEMLKGLDAIKRELPNPRLVNNTGFKQIISKPVLDVFDAWSWPTPTRHDDIRAAARIMLFGMAKDPTYNRFIYDVLDDYADGNPWTITKY